MAEIAGLAELLDGQPLDDGMVDGEPRRRSSVSIRDELYPLLQGLQSEGSMTTDAVGKMTELDASDEETGCSGYWIQPVCTQTNPWAPVVVYIHGGAHLAQTAQSFRTPLLTWAERVGADVLAVDYRVTPETLLEEQLSDCLAAYKYACKRCPGRVFVAGEASGAMLAQHLILSVCNGESGLPVPAGGILTSPRSASVLGMNDGDVGARSCSLSSNSSGLEMTQKRNLSGVGALSEVLAEDAPTGERDRVFQGCVGGKSLPPILLQYGSDEIERDARVQESVQSVLKIREQGAKVRVRRRPSSWYSMWDSHVPEVGVMLGDIRRFVSVRLSQLPGETRAN
jgi:acetyl esterase/lipase